MRVSHDKRNRHFANWISGMTYHPEYNACIKLPPFITYCYEKCNHLGKIVFLLEELILSNDLCYFQSRVILTFRNDKVAKFDLPETSRSLSQIIMLTIFGKTEKEMMLRKYKRNFYNSLMLLLYLSRKFV